MKKILLIVVIVIVVAFVTLLLMPGRQVYQVTPDASDTSTVSSTTQPVSDLPGLDSGATSSANDTTAPCVANMTAQVKSAGTSYDLGSILVAFPSGTTESHASAILASHNLSFDSSASGNFSTDSWTTVDVPKGKEIQSVCELQSDSAVKHAELNTILNLHD